MGDNTSRWAWQHFSLIIAGGILFMGLLFTDRRVLVKNQDTSNLGNTKQSFLAFATKDSVINFLPKLSFSLEQQSVFNGFLQKWEQYPTAAPEDQVRLIQEFAAFFVGSERVDFAALLQEKLWIEHQKELPKLVQRFVETYQEPHISQDSSTFRYFNRRTIEYAERASEVSQGLDKDNLLIAKYIAMVKSENTEMTMQGIRELVRFADTHPENFTANLELAIFSYQTKQYEKALVRVKRAIQATGDQPVAYFWLGKIYNALGNNEQAKNAWQQAKTLKPPQKLLQQINQELQNT